MDSTTKPATRHRIASPRADLDRAPPEQVRAAAIRMRAEHLPELGRRMELPVQFDPTGQMCGGIDVHFMWGAYGVVPTRLVVAYDAPIGELLVPGQGVIERCARYNRALRDLRALRDRFERRLGLRSAPPGAEAAQPALCRLDGDIQARQTARLSARVMPLHMLQAEIEFWESYHAYLAAIEARAERAADAPLHVDDTADMELED